MREPRRASAPVATVACLMNDRSVGSVVVTGQADVVVLNQARQATQFNDRNQGMPAPAFAMS